jgi:hypothetical protein
MDHIQKNWIRVTYVAVSGIVVVASVIYRAPILASQNSLNNFSYVGCVATLVGLIVAILEIVHGASVSRSIRDEVRRIVDGGRSVDRATMAVECLSYLDEASEHVTGERYQLSLKCVQYARKNYMRIASVAQMEEEMTDTMGKIELGLVKGTHTTAATPLRKWERVAIQQDILTMKLHLERLVNVFGAMHVP